MNFKASVFWSVLTALLTAWPSARAAETPNVLLIVSDDLNTSLGCYGNAVCRTPNIDRLAQQGVRFTHAYCQYSMCGPARASLMSGLYPQQTGMMSNSYVLGSYRTTNPRLAQHPSIGGFLRRNGYVSLRIGKIFHMGIPGSIESGESAGDDPDSWDRAFNICAPEDASFGQFTLLSPLRHDFGTAFAQVVVPDADETTLTDWMEANQAIAILQARARARFDFGGDKRLLHPREPFFLAVGFVRPHVPSVAPARLFAHYPADKMQLPFVPPGLVDHLPSAAVAMRNETHYGMNEQQQKQAIAGYYATVEFMDEQVGRLLAELDRLKLRDNTIVIFTSDHGFHLGEHGLWQKTTLFEEGTRIPLIISAPAYRQSAGRQANALVESIDLYPTIADLIHRSAQAPGNLAGKSVVPLLADPDRSGFRDYAYTVSDHGGRSLRSADWRYTRWGDGGEELYDLRADPKEFKNLAADPTCASQLKKLQAAMAEKIASLGPLPAITTKGGD